MLNPEDYFDASDLGLADLNPRIQVNISENNDAGETHPDGTVTAVIEVSEDLAFHSNLDAEKGDENRPLFTKDGELLPATEAALEAIIAERYKGVDFILSEEEGEDSYVTFTITLDVPATTTVEDLSEKIWNETEIVKFHNEADPGTFGTQYLFGSLMYEKLEELSK